MEQHPQIARLCRSLHGQVHLWLVRSLRGVDTASMSPLRLPSPSTARKEPFTMNTTIVNATEYRDLPLTLLTESTTNPRRIFEENALKEFADFVPGHIIGLMFRWPLCGR